MFTLCLRSFIMTSNRFQWRLLNKHIQSGQRNRNPDKLVHWLPGCTFADEKIVSEKSGYLAWHKRVRSSVLKPSPCDFMILGSISFQFEEMCSQVMSRGCFKCCAGRNWRSKLKFCNFATAIFANPKFCQSSDFFKPIHSFLQCKNLKLKQNLPIFEYERSQPAMFILTP